MKTKIETDIKQISRKAGKIKGLIMAKILSLPDNPRIKRLNKNCFILQSSDLGRNWSAEYHDFKATYRIIYKKLRFMQLANIVPFLKEIIATGKFKLPNENYTHHVHPDIQSYLTKLIA